MGLAVREKGPVVVGDDGKLSFSATWGQKNTEEKREFLRCVCPANSNVCEKKGVIVVMIYGVLFVGLGWVGRETVNTNAKRLDVLYKKMTNAQKENKEAS